MAVCFSLLFSIADPKLVAFLANKKRSGIEHKEKVMDTTPVSSPPGKKTEKKGTPSYSKFKE